LRQLPRLRAVFHGAGSVRPYVTEAFWRRNITITTAAAANAIPVAEYTLGAILLSLKQTWSLQRQTRNARAFPKEFPAIKGTRGATVGRVSLGLIGREVLRRLRSFDVQVIVHDPYLPAGKAAELGVKSVSLTELMARSDIVSLHSPLNAETKGFITGALLAHLQPGATFINTARGGLINEPELITFLRNRPDVQAILDVTSPEPPPSESPLYDLPNVFLTPHIAGSMGLECRRMGWTMVEEFGRFARGEPLSFALTREQALQQT
jgi:phosphoglycerate dehydrogenase-like enzyme